MKLEKKSVNINMKISPTEKEKLEEVAIMLESTVSDLIRRVMREYIDKFLRP